MRGKRPIANVAMGCLLQGTMHNPHGMAHKRKESEGNLKIVVNAAYVGTYLRTFSGSLSGRSSRLKHSSCTAWSLKMGPTGWTKMLVNDYNIRSVTPTVRTAAEAWNFAISKTQKYWTIVQDYTKGSAIVQSDWTVRASNSNWGKRFVHSPKRQNRLWEPPSLLFSSSGVLSPGIRRSGREADLSPNSSAEAKNQWSCTFITPVFFRSVGRGNHFLIQREFPQPAPFMAYIHKTRGSNLSGDTDYPHWPFPPRFLGSCTQMSVCTACHSHLSLQFIIH
jgi:hypothetical protein